MRNLLILLFIIWSISQVFTQTPSVYSDRHSEYKLGQYFFEHYLYGVAQKKYADYSHLSTMSVEGNYKKLKDEAAFQSEIAGVRMEFPEAENKLNYLVDEHLPDPVTTAAILELGSYYYNKREYKYSVETYEKADLSILPVLEQSEARFKKGYSFFVMKEFDKSKNELSKFKDEMNIYYYPTNYYLGVNEYFLGNYEAAVSSFQKVTNSQAYKSYTPYYICQIYAVQNQQEKLITYGEQALMDKNLQKRKEIRLLLGQTYFKKNDYQKALPHLEYYEENTNELTVEEFYQLGFTQYQLKKYESSIKNFDAINLEDNKIGQLSNYYLADCYLKTGDKNSARSAFKKVSQMAYEPTMQSEALFNYGKLSAETGLEREAINTLLKIEENSKYYKESQDLISDVLEKSADLDYAMGTIEGLKNISTKLKSTYQSLALKAGIKTYNENNLQLAEANFNKSLKYKESKIQEAQARFWLAQISQNKGETKTSISGFEQYFSTANGQQLPFESSPLMAHYSQGYNFLELKDYKKAENSFKNVMTAFNTQKEIQKNQTVAEKILPDSYLRLGDCLFKQRDYNTALKQYQFVIDKNHQGQDYALYQKGVILGLLGEPYEKIIVLQELTTKFKNSEFGDNAYMQTGETYLSVGSTDNAYKAFQTLVQNFQNKSNLINVALLKMGLIAYNRGDLQTSIAHYKDVLKNNPNPKESSAALISLEEIYINDLGKPDEYVKVLETVPGYKVDAFATDSLNFAVGENRFLNGEYERAIIGLSSYLDKFPKGFFNVKAKYYRAESNAVLKNYSEALKDYILLIDQGKNEYFELSLKKAAIISYNYTLDFKLAYKYYDQYFSETKNSQEKYQASLGALRSAFRTSMDTGIMKYAEIVTTENLATNEEKATAHYYLGKTLYTKKELDKAFDNFKKVSALATNNQAAESRYLMADIFFQKQQFIEAENQCNAANKENKYYPYWIAKSLLLLSDIYVHKNDLFNARAAIEAVIENFKDDEGLLKNATEKLKALELKEKDQNRIKSNKSNLLNLDDKP